ncbi:hypothetical protein ACN23B_17905 [Anabaena sp. FACHB-709]|nr:MULTISPECIES: hypothetical protein [Nostocaceae]
MRPDRALEKIVRSLTFVLDDKSKLSLWFAFGRNVITESAIA